MENRGAERQPAEQLVPAQREGARRAGPRPNCQHAETEGTGDRAQAESLRNLPRESG